MAFKFNLGSAPPDSGFRFNLGEPEEPVDYASLSVVEAARFAEENKPFRFDLRPKTSTAVTRREQPSGSFGPSTIARAERRGAKQTGGLVGQLLKSVGDSTGLGSLVEIGDELVEEAFVEAVANPARIQGFEDIRGIRDVTEFVAQTFGEQAMNLAIAAGSGGIGAGLGRYVAKRAIGKALVDNVAKKAASTATLRGAEAGAFAGFLPINTGELLQEARDQGFKPELGPNLLVGAGSTAFEVLGFELVGRSIFKGFSKASVEHTLKQVLKRIGFTSLGGLAAEGGTEAAQEAIVIASRKLNDPTFSIGGALSSSENLKRITFAGVSGAVVGGFLGGAGSTVTNVAGATKAGLQSSRIRSSVRQAAESLTEMFEASASGKGKTEEETDQPQEVRSLFDVEIAQRKVAEGVKRARSTVATAVAAVKTKLSPADQQAQIIAAEEHVQAEAESLAHEITSLDMASEELEQSAGFFGEAVNRLREGLENIESIAEKTAKQSEASKKMATEIKEILEEAKAIRDPQKRAAKAREMLELAQKGISKGLVDPASVAKDRLRVLTNAAERIIKKGLKQKRTALTSYRGALKVLSNQVELLSAKIPALPEESTKTETGKQQGLTTPIEEVARSITAMVRDGKKSAFVVGRTVEELEALPAIKRRLDENGFVLTPLDGEVKISRPENVDADGVAENFTTPVEQIDPADAVVGTTRDSEGGVIENEVFDKRNTVPIGQKAAAAGRAGGSFETRAPHEAITESTKEHIAETQRHPKNRIKKAKDSLSQAFRSLTKFTKENPGAPIPNFLPIFTDKEGFPVVWAEFQDMLSDANFLVSQFMDLQQFWVDPDQFTKERPEAEVKSVQDLQDLVEAIHDGVVDPEFLYNTTRALEEQGSEFFVWANNNRLINAVVDENGEYVGEGGEGFTFFASAEAALSKLELITSKKKLGAGITELEPLQVEGGWVLTRVFQDGQIVEFNRQVRVALEEGSKKAVDGKETPFIIPAVSRNGTKVWFSLGEITNLGWMINRGENTVLDKMTNAHKNFMTGLAVLTDDGKRSRFEEGVDKNAPAYGYKIDVNQRKMANKFIYGRVTFKKSDANKKGMYRIRAIAEEHGYEVGLGKLVEYFRVDKKKPKGQQISTGGRIDWNEVADWLIDESIKTNGAVSAEDISFVLRSQGAIMEDKWSRLNANLSHAEPEAGIVGATERVRDIDELPVDNTVPISPVSTVINKPAGGPTIQITNTLTDPKYKNIWKAAETAVKFVVDMLNIKQPVTLFDENSAEELIAYYTVKRDQAIQEIRPEVRRSKRQAGTYQNYINEINRATADAAAGKINGRFVIINKGRDVLVFVSNNPHPVKGLGKQSPSRGLVLMHEIGHLIQHTHLMQLSPALRKKVLADFSPKTEADKIEAFANWMAKLAADKALLETGKVSEKLRNGDPYGGLFVRIIEDLKRAWEGLKDTLWKKNPAAYPAGFQSFVDALLSHSRVQRGPKFKGETISRDRASRAKAKKVESLEEEIRKFKGKQVFEQARVDRLYRIKRPTAAQIEARIAAKLRLEDINSELHELTVDLSETKRASTIVDSQSEVGSTLKNPLSKAIFAELQALENGGAYIPQRQVDIVTANMENAGERAQTSAFQNYFDDFKNFAETLKRNPKDAAKMMVYTSDGELRSMNLTWLADKFHVQPGTVGDSLTIFREIQQFAAPFHRELKRVLDAVPGAGDQFRFFRRRANTDAANARAYMARLQEALMTVREDHSHLPLSEIDVDLRQDVQRIRKYLNDLHKALLAKGLHIPERKNYFPMMLDSYKIEHNRDLFVEILQRHGWSERGAQSARQKLTRDEDGGLTNGFNQEQGTTSEFFGPGFASARQRSDTLNGKWTPGLRNDLAEAGFYQEDIATTLFAYTEMASRRAVWESNFKETGPFTLTLRARYKAAGLEDQMHSSVAKLKLQLAEARNAGQITDWQYQRVTNDILPGYAGQLGLRTDSRIRRISAAVIIYQNLRILGFAVLSSIVDVGTLISRGDFQALQDTITQFTNDVSRDEARVMLEEMGGIRQGLAEHILNDQAMNTWMTGKAKQINDLFFRYNLMEGWTNMIRTMALLSGRSFLQRHAQGVNENSARYLAELGITAEEIRAWDGSSTSNQRINAALNRYVDEAMIRPNPSIRPTWMSDPSYAIFAHLKGFMYGFHETFTRRALNEVKIHQNLLPLLMLGMMALPFAAIGYELRRKITGSKQQLEGGAYLLEVTERSGILGPFQFVADMEQAGEFGKPYALGITGPSVEQLYDFWTKDLEAFIPRAIPLVASFPQARDWIADEIG